MSRTEASGNLLQSGFWSEWSRRPDLGVGRVFAVELDRRGHEVTQRTNECPSFGLVNRPVWEQIIVL